MSGLDPTMSASYRVQKATRASPASHPRRKRVVKVVPAAPTWNISDFSIKKYYSDSWVFKNERATIASVPWDILMAAMKREAYNFIYYPEDVVLQCRCLPGFQDTSCPEIETYKDRKETIERLKFLMKRFTFGPSTQEEYRDAGKMMNQLLRNGNLLETDISSVSDWYIKLLQKDNSDNVSRSCSRRANLIAVLSMLTHSRNERTRKFLIAIIEELLVDRNFYQGDDIARVLLTLTEIAEPEDKKHVESTFKVVMAVESRSYEINMMWRANIGKLPITIPNDPLAEIPDPYERLG